MKPVRALIPALALAALAACSGDDHLPEGKMADVIADLQIAEAVSNSSTDFQTDSARNVMRMAILEKHGVTQEEYDASLRWYGHNLEKYTKLNERVEKVLARKEKKLMASSAGEKEGKESGTQLWPYSAMAFISPLGNSDAIQFSIPVNNLPKGERLKWKMRLSKTAPVQIMLGVDYADGATSYISQRYSGNTRLELQLQGDSTRTITRLYGYMRVDRRSDLPVWADSIQLTHLPLAKETYGSFTMQKLYDGPVHRAAADSVKHRPPTVRPITDNPEPQSVQQSPTVQQAPAAAPSSGSRPRPGGSPLRRMDGTVPDNAPVLPRRR
ncbi:MAG: DUF4296 domain-containing protein [Muribaculaceae bacterium]|nr:DUF4296 domain-containing protein [Muribaculaceae bacterium]